MAPANDKPKDDANEKGPKKAKLEPAETEPRRLNRQELETLRWQLHRKFHRSST